MKIVSIVGARPEFVQAVSLTAAFARDHQEVLVHTGQHYDYLMSQAFFEQLPLPEPSYNLEVGPGSRPAQLAAMIARLERVLETEQPDAVLVRGDTTSTLAGAITAHQMDFPLIHVEAGERSYDRSMPEEMNRIVTDQLADVHFCASERAVKRLDAEGIRASVHFVGDVMLDVLLSVRDRALDGADVLDRLGVERGRYSVVTIHRAGNTDSPDRLGALVQAINAAPDRVVFPVHPRTRPALDRLGVSWGGHVIVTDPVGYFDMIALEANARLIATDSGGVQREAYFLGIPCLTLRDSTEWVETVDTGWNLLVGADVDRILSAWTTFSPPSARPAIFGDGHAAERIVNVLERGLDVLGPRTLAWPATRSS